jgi:hypothetical protein
LGPFELETGRSVDVNISLSQFAVALDPVTVTAEMVTGYLEAVGFYRRQRTNAAGRFLDRADIEERLSRAGDVAELLTGVMGMEVGDPVPGSFGASLDVQRGQLSVAGCPWGPRIYLDGLVIENRPIGGNHIVLSGLVRPEEVYGIEVYRTPSQIPIEYGGAESACGVLVIWTINGPY